MKKRTTKFVLGLIVGIGAAFEADGVSSIITYSWMAIGISILRIVSSVKAKSNAKAGGIIITIAAISGFIFIFMFYILPGILLLISGLMAIFHKDNSTAMNRNDPNAELKAEIKPIYEEHEGRYGYCRIRDELANRNQIVNHKKVQRIMKELGLKCLVRMKKYKSYKGTVGKIALHILERNFTADAPNEKWVTDITEFKLFGEKLYLSPVLDLYNG